MIRSIQGSQPSDGSNLNVAEQLRIQLECTLKPDKPNWLAAAKGVMSDNEQNGYNQENGSYNLLISTLSSHPDCVIYNQQPCQE
jgi:hypothetical protein